MFLRSCYGQGQGQGLTSLKLVSTYGSNYTFRGLQIMLCSADIVEPEPYSLLNCYLIIACCLCGGIFRPETLKTHL